MCMRGGGLDAMAPAEGDAGVGGSGAGDTSVEADVLPM